MKISHNGTDYELSFNTDYMDILCFELGYELEDIDIPFLAKKNDDGSVIITDDGGVIPVINKHSVKKLGDFIYSFAKAFFVGNPENIGLEFPLTRANLFGVAMTLSQEKTENIILEFKKAKESNLTDAQLNAQKANTGIKKKPVGQK